MVQGVSFSGLASGLDTDDIVKQLMDIERISVRRLEARKEVASVEQEAWQEINQRLQGFDSSISALRDRSTFESRVVNSGMDNVMTATARRGTAPANYQIHVQQLATGHRVTTENVADIVENGAEANVDTELGLTGSFEINGEVIEVSAEDSLRDIREAINQSDAEVTATFIDNRMILNSNETGEDSTISLADISEGEEDNILKALGILDGEGEIVEANNLQTAQNAIFEVDGLIVERQANQELDDVIDGVTLNLEGTNQENEVFTLSIHNDQQQTIDAVSSFVDEYNAVQAFLREYGAEEALLQGDGTLRRLATSLRQQVTDSVFIPGEYTNASSVGIEIDRDGIMNLDEARLMEAIQENPGDVQQLFRASEADEGTDGIANRIRNRVQQYIRSGTGILVRRDQSIQQRINRIDSRIESQERRLEMREKSLTRQFARMEVALNELQAQSSWLQGQIGSLLSFRE